MRKPIACAIFFYSFFFFSSCSKQTKYKGKSLVKIVSLYVLRTIHNVRVKKYVWDKKEEKDIFTIHTHAYMILQKGFKFKETGNTSLVLIYVFI